MDSGQQAALDVISRRMSSAQIDISHSSRNGKWSTDGNNRDDVALRPRAASMHFGSAPVMPRRASAGGVETAEPTGGYLQQLLLDQTQLKAYPNVFVHVTRLVEEEVARVRARLFDCTFAVPSPTELPEPEGPSIMMQERVLVPVKENPDYNFVGRILGPRGMTAKQLEQQTGCKIMVRGRGSMRDQKRVQGIEYGMPLRPSYQHLDDDLHVLIQVEDSPNRGAIKLQRAVEEVKKLLVPAKEGEDDLKRKQLMELAIINGTYRPASQNSLVGQTPRLISPNGFPLPSMTGRYSPYYHQSPANSPTPQQIAEMTAVAHQYLPPSTPSLPFEMASSPVPTHGYAGMSGSYFNYSNHHSMSYPSPSMASSSMMPPFNGSAPPSSVDGTLTVDINSPYMSGSAGGGCYAP